jgi:Na+-transporting NADH:ubiquinone oxidoreductase subunit C
MNTNSNSYTFIYSSVLVILVAAALAFTNGALKDKQAKNVDVDKMQQILHSLKITAEYDAADQIFKQTITRSYLINSAGVVVDSTAASAFVLDIAKEVTKPVSKRLLPVFEASINKEKKYILPVYGAGLWGPIWGYVALNADKNTIFATSFSHQGETPGLGAEISTSAFQAQFTGKHLLKDGMFRSVAVVKPGQTNESMDYVDGISGGTITSKGVHNMLLNCLSAYETFLKK